jgi:hypothetical protein
MQNNIIIISDALSKFGVDIEPNVNFDEFLKSFNFQSLKVKTFQNSNIQTICVFEIQTHK